MKLRLFSFISEIALDISKLDCQIKESKVITHMLGDRGGDYFLLKIFNTWFFLEPLLLSS